MLLDRVFDNPKIFKATQTLFNSGSKGNDLEKKMDYGQADTFLDLGCGSGDLSTHIKADYTGLDMCENFVKFVSEKYGDERTRFYQQDIRDLDNKKYDYVTIVDVLHHLGDEDADKVIRQAVKKARKVVYVLAMSEGSNLFGKILVKLDRGQHARPKQRLIALMKNHANIVKLEKVKNRAYVYFFFKLEAKRRV